MSEDVWTPDDEDSQTVGYMKAVKGDGTPEVVEQGDPGPRLADPDNQAKYPVWPIYDGTGLPPNVFNADQIIKYFQPYGVRVDELAAQAIELQITSPEAWEIAHDMLGQLKKFRKEIEQARTNDVNPYGSFAKVVIAVVKIVRDPIDKVTPILSKKIVAYDDEQAELERRIALKKAEAEAEEKRKELEVERQADLARQKKERDEAIARKAELEAQAEEAGVEPVEVKIPKILDPGIEEPVIVTPKRVAGGPTRTATGTSYTVKKWKYKLIDLDKVPEEYTSIILVEKYVLQAIESGVREIPGLEIYEDSMLRHRSKQGG